MSADPDGPLVVFDDPDNFHAHADRVVDVIALLASTRQLSDLTPSEQHARRQEILERWRSWVNASRRN